MASECKSTYHVEEIMKRDKRRLKKRTIHTNSDLKVSIKASGETTYTIIKFRYDTRTSLVRRSSVNK